VKVGKNHLFKKKTCTFIGEQVEKPSKVTNSTIMDATKELVEELLLHLKDAPTRNFDLEELVLVFYKHKYMSLLSI
jgi:hypothetical protein